MNKENEWCQILANSAGEYCDMIDQLDRVDSDWLDNLASLLPRIHAAISSLQGCDAKQCPHLPAMDLDKRFELYTRLRKLLGDHDGYALDYDKPEELEGMSGSLADDFTDIYFELKRGLEVLQSEPESLSQAMDVWYGGYMWHWGQHLVDAEKHLYDLQVHRRLGSSMLVI